VLTAERRFASPERGSDFVGHVVSASDALLVATRDVEQRGRNRDHDATDVGNVGRSRPRFGELDLQGFELGHLVTQAG
jgi:hypothetical protein